MVGNAFKIANDPQIFCCKGTVALPYLAGAEFDQVTADDILVMVSLGFILTDMFGGFLIIGGDGVQAFPQRFHRIAGHIGNERTAALQCKSRSSQQALVQFGLPLGLFAFRYQPKNQFFQQTTHWQEDRSAKNIKYGMGYCDAPLASSLPQQSRSCHGTNDIKQDDTNRCTDDIEVEVDQCCPAGIFIGANGRKQRCNTGADILSHNDRDSGAIGDLPRAGQRLKDTHRCRAGLDNASEHRADQNTQNRIGKHEENFTELRNIS